MLQYRLESQGYDVMKAYNGKEAMEKIRESRPDLIILDAIMPPPDGFQICRDIKDDDEYKDIPVIMLTVRAGRDDEFWAKECGADVFITKPYDTPELLLKARILLGEA